MALTSGMYLCQVICSNRFAHLNPILGWGGTPSVFRVQLIHYLSQGHLSLYLLLTFHFASDGALLSKKKSDRGGSMSVFLGGGRVKHFLPAPAIDIDFLKTY